MSLQFYRKASETEKIKPFTQCSTEGDKEGAPSRREPWRPSKARYNPPTPQPLPKGTTAHDPAFKPSLSDAALPHKINGWVRSLTGEVGKSRKTRKQLTTAKEKARTKPPGREVTETPPPGYDRDILPRIPLSLLRLYGSVRVATELWTTFPRKPEENTARVPILLHRKYWRRFGDVGLQFPQYP